MKQIVFWTSWAVWKKRPEVNLKDSRLRTFCNVQIFCQKLYWRVWSILLICPCVSPHSSYLAFLLRSNMVAIHILHKLVMKMASWGFVLSVWFFRRACYLTCGDGEWGSVQFRNRVCAGALCVRRGGFWRCDRCSHGKSVKFVASMCSVLAK